MRKYLRVANVFEDHIDTTDVMEMQFSDEEFDRYRLSIGDVLLNEGQSPHLLGRPAIYRGDPPNVAFTNSLIRFQASAAVLPQWALLVFRHHMHSKRFMRESRITTNIAHLSLSRLSSVEFPIPPLAEQKRIVAAIEEEFSRLDAGVQTLRAALSNLAALRRSTIQLAVTGRLVRRAYRNAGESQEVPICPQGWTESAITDIATVGSGATPLRSDRRYWEGGTVPWVTTGLLNQSVVKEAVEFITPFAVERTAVKLWPAGTLLVAMYGEGRTRGTCSELAMAATCNQACAAIVLTTEMTWYRPFLKLVFEARYEENRRLAVGGVQPNLSLSFIKAMRVPIPPPQEQQEILAAVASWDDLVGAVRSRLSTSETKVHTLRSSVLATAFAGRLVSQDAADEPAAERLKRVGTEARDLRSETSRELVGDIAT
jgi:type I restriction enzyme S subunit